MNQVLPPVYFLPIHPENMTEGERILLISTAPADYNGRTAVEIIEGILKGRLHLWRVMGLMQGLLITRIGQNRKGKTLWIEGIGGEGLVENRDQVHKALRALARRAGCSTFSGLIQRGGMEWVLKSTSIPIVAHIFEDDVDAQEESIH